MLTGPAHTERSKAESTQTVRAESEQSGRYYGADQTLDLPQQQTVSSRDSGAAQRAIESRLRAV